MASLLRLLGVLAQLLGPLLAYFKGRTDKESSNLKKTVKKKNAQAKVRNKRSKRGTTDKLRGGKF